MRLTARLAALVALTAAVGFVLDHLAVRLGKRLAATDWAEVAGRQLVKHFCQEPDDGEAMDPFEANVDRRLRAVT